jgi:hypothetical protein
MLIIFLIFFFVICFLVAQGSSKFTSEQFHAIFSNIESIVTLHTTLLAQLKVTTININK